MAKETNGAALVYNRQQTGHSIVKLLCFDWLRAYIPTIYYIFSPNHYFHL